MSNYDCLKDKDADLVPDWVEKNTAGCDYESRYSCPGRPEFLHDKVPDTEFNAYNVGWQWVPGTADSEDWACPGKQCPGHYH